ncbi:hypothetical protein [Methylosinus sp. LW3]|uniref:hypothetical protein n=1 Tax=Methylosinus sp. LW3 TaxID=107635 RepID=UPI0018DCC221|nr:hypothetical protein [Methylosinus sp. LW3]
MKIASAGASFHIPCDTWLVHHGDFRARHPPCRASRRVLLLAAATAIGPCRIEKFCDPDSRPGRQQPRESALPRGPDFRARRSLFLSGRHDQSPLPAANPEGVPRRLHAAASTQRLHYITIRTSEVRRIKNLYSERSVVLHPELICLGFLDYVAAVRALGYEMVFPDLKSPTSSSPLGDRLYDELIDGLHQAIPDAKERKKVIHSMRKSFGNRLKQEGIHSEIRGDIMGHSGATPSEEIYCDAIALAKMLPSIMKIPIVTAHLQPHPIRLLPWVEEKLPPPFSRKRREAEGAGPRPRQARKIKGEPDRC